MNAVAIVSQADLYFGNTAASVRMNNYAKALALAGVDVYLFSTYMNVSLHNIIEVEPRIHVCNRTNKTIKWFNIIGLLKFVYAIKNTLKQSSSGFSLLNYSASTSLLLDIMLLLLFKKQCVFCEVNEVRKYASESKNRIIDNIYCFLLERTYPKYYGLVFISKNIQDYYSHLTKRSIVIPILSDCRSTIGPVVLNNSFNIVFLGTVSFAKENLEELLKGFLLFSRNKSNTKLFFYGNISEKDEVKLNSFTSLNNLQDKIFYMGTIMHKDVYSAMSSADVLVLPRKNNKQNYYGFSTKLSEYAIAGVPIIMTDTGVIKDYFHDGIDCIICDGYNDRAFESSFERMYKMDVSERRKMANNAYIVAKSNFDYRLYSDKLKSFLFGANE